AWGLRHGGSVLWTRASLQTTRHIAYPSLTPTAFGESISNYCNGAGARNVGIVLAPRRARRGARARRMRYPRHAPCGRTSHAHERRARRIDVGARRTAREERRRVAG